MTKKHFIALADHIREHNKYSEHAFTQEQLESLANFLARQNSQFMRGRWMAYILGECGPNGGAVKKAKSYETRVRDLERKGLTRSDAQAVADAEELRRA